MKIKLTFPDLEFIFEKSLRGQDINRDLSDVPLNKRAQLVEACESILGQVDSLKPNYCHIYSHVIDIKSFHLMVPLDLITDTLEDLCTNPTKYYSDGGSDPIWDFLRYIHLDMPSGRSYRLLDLVDGVE
jgi:hypothetical protein